MSLVERPDECFLHEVVRPNRVTGQGSGIAPYPRDFLFETMAKIVNVVWEVLTTKRTVAYGETQQARRASGYAV